MLDYYKKLLQNKETYFINKYLSDPYLIRLKTVGYFCGMDYASKDIYDFSEYISRYDHSLNVALLVYKLTKDKTMTIAGLYHDIATPCFSHVIDYMNKDYLNQESTEALTKSILENDIYLQELLKEDNIELEDIINYKKYSIVDNDRPKLCADRLDAIILNSIGWIKNISKEDIREIISDLIIYQNEEQESEIGFIHEEIAKKAVYYNNIINEAMHSKEDIYMMQLLADMVKYAINNNYISYYDLYQKSETGLLNTFNQTGDEYLINMIQQFQTITKEEISKDSIVPVKNRDLSPLTKARRIYQN